MPTPTDTEIRLLEAVIEELSEFGYRGATTRSIAERAGVNEVTLFRRFGSKAELVRRAMIRVTETFRTAVHEPTDDVEADLADVAEGFVSFIDANPGLVARVLPELAADEELRTHALPIQRALVEGLLTTVGHHQRADRLAEEPAGAVVRAFMGPLAARALLAHVLAPEPFDARAYARRFLDGWGADGEANAET